MKFLLNFLLDQNLELTSSILINFFPIIVSGLYLLFGLILLGYKRKNIPTRFISVIFILISFYFFSNFVILAKEWAPAIQAGLLLVISVFQIVCITGKFENLLLNRAVSIVVFTFTFLILTGQLFIDVFDYELYDFGETGLLNFWSGNLLLISCIASIFRTVKIGIPKKINLWFSYEIVSLFFFVPLGIWAISNFNQQPIVWLYFPFLIGLLWFGIFILFDTRKQVPLLPNKESKIPTFTLGLSSIFGLFLVGLATFANPTLFTHDQSLLFVGVYIFFFSVVLFYYWVLLGNQSEKKKKIPGFQKLFDEKNFDSIEDLWNNLNDFIVQEVNPVDHLIFTLDAAKQRFVPMHFADQTGSNLSFSKDSSLVQKLLQTKDPIIFKDTRVLPEDLMDEKEKLDLLGANSLIPIKTDQQLLGWISLTFDEADKENIQAKTKSIVPFTNDLGGTFKRMDDQMKLEQREKNFNVLSRIVQGVNYTLDLDDIYELIFAQTSQVIPSDDFFIILKEENAPKLNFVFYVVQDERIHEKEKQFISLNGSLEAEVVRSGRGVIANNYHEFCRSRGFDYLSDHIKNALIAPLNSGDKTNGCLFLGRHENENPFSDDQLDLLQSIADLVAGAIEKARLLEKTEQYAHQLSLLNEIVRELSSITNINQLLKSILDYSTKLVNFEEARLLMVDQDTGDLIFQEVKGENSLPLKGSIVSNKLDWFRKIQGTKEIITLDQNTSTNPTTLSHYKNQGIVVQSLMLIPLVIKENVLGVIELINHKNDHYFSDNDKQLMQSFSAQAAITWENARLYQQTDQELAERVEELSIMQKIDRELNTSLDTDTVLRITLSWAIKFLGTDAGWIGLVDNGIINHINYVGYEEKEERDLPETILLENIRKIDFDQKIEPGKIINNELFAFHSSTQEQVLSPIYREGELIAIMLLESPSEIHFSNNQKRFLERLSDHASIAITNSKLYDEVHKANEAKSEFVSLVAHELKNPMTSIKGYTELLTTGAAGEISETQLNFLSIIRNNTERMNALVSDLNDLTKIETGNIHLEMKPIVLDEMVDELVRSLKKQFEQKNQTFQFIVESGLPALKADPNRLSQVLINLLSNANKYTQETGQITLVAEKTNQVGEKYFDQPIAHIWVQDNGYGISEQDQKFIFQKFFRSEDQNIRAVSGTGLGLNITRSFVEMMGGSIWFESEIGKGTTFHVVVPFIDHI